MPRRSAAMRQLSELFIRSTALKLAIALAKLPLKLLLSYYRLTMFLLYRINKPRMEEIGATIAKYLAVIASFMAPVVRLHTTNHPVPPDSPVY